MGLRRTGHRSVGQFAVRALPLAALVLLAGCTSSVRIAAVVSGGVAGASTGSPAVGFLVGVATDTAANYVVRVVGRTRQGAEQDAIAAAVGELPVGTSADWTIEHTIPIGDEHGRFQVVRVIDSPLAVCKEIAFSVEDNDDTSWYTANICKQTDAWKWASAEPAVARWGFLQ